VAFVAVVSALSAAIFITVAILGLTFLRSIFAGGFIIIIIVVYLIGATRLTKAIGDKVADSGSLYKNYFQLRVVKLTRQVAGVLIVNTLIQGSYAVLGSGNTLMPLQIIIVDLLMPFGLSVALLLLLRFIRGSFERKGQQRKNKSTRAAGSRATASVSPATNFKENFGMEFIHGAASTAPAQSSSQAWTATVPDSPSSSETRSSLGSKS